MCFQILVDIELGNWSNSSSKLSVHQSDEANTIFEVTREESHWFGVGDVTQNYSCRSQKLLCVANVDRPGAHWKHITRGCGGKLNTYGFSIEYLDVHVKYLTNVHNSESDAMSIDIALSNSVKIQSSVTPAGCTPKRPGTVTALRGHSNGLKWRPSALD